MARQTPRIKPPPLAAEYYRRYVRFSEQLHHHWMQYELYPELYLISEEKNEDIEYKNQIRIASSSPINPEKRVISRLRGFNIPGFLKRLHKREIPETIFVSSVSLFEAFVSDVAKVAYIDNPQRFLLSSTISGNQNVNEKENFKLLKMLIQSQTREEAIEKYIEERLRGIFYGNPMDVFTKNKLRFGFQQIMMDQYSDELKQYSEIVARRNIIVHNFGIIDQKYLREVENPTFSYNDKVSIEKDYLYDTLKVMNTIAKVYVQEVSKSTTGRELPQVRM